MTSRIIVKNLPKKISDEKFKQHFEKIGQITEAKLKYTKDGKFRQFGFIGFKNEDEARKAIDYFNNTYIDASKIQIEVCRPLNDLSGDKKTWSKHSVKSTKVIKASEKGLIEVETDEKKKQKVKNKEKKLELLLGPLNDDPEFKEFLAANNAIKSKDNIWKNDINLELTVNSENPNTKLESNAKKTKKKEKKFENDENKRSVEVESDQSKAVATGKNEKEYQIDEDIDFENGRLFLRNLCYSCKEEDLEKLFAPYGPLVEVAMPIDKFSKAPVGFAYITCMFPEKAIKAFNELDGTVYQGRMLHIIPALNKKKNDLAENVGSNSNGKGGFKDKKEAELKKTAQSSHNWNSLFISQDAVANIMAAKYNVDKSEIYNPHSTNRKNQPSTAVKLAVGETQIVNDIRKFLTRNGVKLDAFASAGTTERSKTCILVKNLPSNTTENEVRDLFKKCGMDTDSLKRFVMPEYGTAALIEFGERQEARDAFKKLAYRKFKSVPVYLEWAPVDVFDGSIENEPKEEMTPKVSDKKLEKEEEEKNDDEDEYEDNATIFVKNLNFDTTDDCLKMVFSKIGKCKATIARKISPNKEMLSMGYGFVKFKKAAYANEALKTLQDHSLDGHNLELKFSNKTNKFATNNNNNNNNNKNKKNQKDLRERSSKILVRNIPFEAKVKEIQELFQVFGELKYARLPKKIDGAHRGFGFVDFVTISDAQKAFDALSLSTHLFGRRLVLEWAEPEQSQDVEILRAKEEQISGFGSKKLKRSNILEDLESVNVSENKMDTNY